MTVMKTLRAFMRGCFSALELFPTSSRRATRDAMVDAQAMSVGTVWMQVGELLREAQGEFSGKKATQSNGREPSNQRIEGSRKLG
jgi:hypothetical protein